MKLSFLFFTGSLILFAAGLTEAKEKSHEREKSQAHHQRDSKKPLKGNMRNYDDRKRDRHSQREQDHRRHDTHRYNGDRHEGHRYSQRRENKSHRYSKHRSHYDDRRHYKRDHRQRWKGHSSWRSDYLLGGLILGGVIHHAFHDGYESCPDRHYRPRNNYFWSVDYGQCYKIKSGYRGDVYAEVPRYRCR